MVSFLRDVMIVVAIVATLVAWALYPNQESAHATVRSPVDTQPAPVAATTGVDAVNPAFEKRP